MFPAIDFNICATFPYISIIINPRVMQLTGSQNKHLLFFTKSGKKQGEIQLDYPVTSAAVIDDKTLAVATCRAVVFVDTHMLKRIDLTPMRDKCIGIAYEKKSMFILTSSYQYTIIGYHFNEWIQARGVACHCAECEMALISE
jgi:hypothetical protein